jgi:hypothetical protein
MESLLMRLTRARYVTVCQQFLVTAMVLAVGLSAAGVMTLQIVAPEAHAPQASGMAPAVRVSDAYVDTAPVTPKVREVKVDGVEAAAAREIPGVVTAKKDSKKKLAALSAPTRVQGYATVGVTWRSGTKLSEDEISVQVRTRTGASWSGWTTAAYHDEHGPDAGTSEAAHVRPGTDAVVVGDVDEVQVRADTTTGDAPADLELAVVDPGVGAMAKQAPAIDTASLQSADQGSDQSARQDSAPDTSAPDTDGTSGGAAALMAMKVTPKPQIYSRAQWGANEALRDKSSLSYGTIKTGFIHHTVNANSYSLDQVPALLRGIYAYHTQSRGWSDIGYNFLVDRFGRIWEGRYGGVDRPVVGAHTLGYNQYSFAMSAIGNFDIAAPPQAILDAYARLFAWKLSLSNIRADATRLWVKDRYLQAINGHRDVGQTACPGRYLYAKIPAIRVATQALQNKAQAPVDPVNEPMIPAPSGVPSPTQAPGAAAAQPAISFPARSNVAGSAWPDLLVLRPTTGIIQVVPTEGVLDYTTRVVTSGAWSRMSAIAAVGDLTGDGRSDVLAKNGRTGVARVFPGDGRGHVTSGIAPTTAFKGISRIVGVRDFSRDGRNDVMGISRKTGSLMLFRGAGHGTFRAPVRLRTNWPFGHTVGVGDLNGDGQPDLAGTLGAAGVYLIPGARRGKALGTAVRLTTASATVSALYGWGDLNGDKRADLMVRTGTRTTMYAGTGGNRLGQVYGPFNGLGGLASASLAPMAGTGAADMVGRDAAGRLVVVVNNGRRNTSLPLGSNLAQPGASQVLNVGDWDRDGRSDVVVRKSANDLLVLFPGLGNGRFGRPRSLGTGWKPITLLSAVGDVTGDGYPDLMGRNATGPMTIFPGAGTNAFKAPVLAPSSMRTYHLIGPHAWSANGAVFASGNGTFVPVTGTDPVSALRMANDGAAPSYDTYVGVGDANGDGVKDLLARERRTGIIWLLPGKTSGGFAPRMWVANGYAGYQLVD